MDALFGDTIFRATWHIAALVVGAFLLGGTIKGIIGVGLPVITFGILSSFMPVQQVVGYMAIPIIITNLGQTIHSGNPMPTVKRFWPVIVCLVIGVTLSAQLVVKVDPHVIYIIIGPTVIAFAVINLLKPDLSFPPRYEKPLGFLAGSLGGLLGGIATIWGPPISMYLIALKLEKDELIRAIGLIWLCASVPLIAAYIYYDILNAQTWQISAIATVPAMAGFYIGAWLRKFISQEVFKKTVLIFLIFIGFNLIGKALL